MIGCTWDVLVCGGRDFIDAPTLYWKLGQIHRERGINSIITGGAKGADEMADYWATRNRIELRRFPISKEEWKRLGRKAGPLRNQRMMDEGMPNLVVAFPGGSGTADMVRRAEAAQIEVIKIPADQVMSRHGGTGE